MREGWKEKRSRMREGRNEKGNLFEMREGWNEKGSRFGIREGWNENIG